MTTANSKQDIIIESPLDFQYLYHYIDRFKTGGNVHNELNIYLSEKVKFIRPAEVLMLVQFIIIFTKHSDITLFSEERINRYLNAISISEFCDKNYEQSEMLNAIMSATAMPIRRVTRERMPEYIHYAENYFKSFCPNKNLAQLELSFAELINNVYDHSKSEIDAYVFCQYFRTKNVIKIAVSDFGRGIPGSIKEANIPGIDLNNEIECLSWAIQPSNSIKSIPNNMGLGLSNVIDFAKTNKGNLVLLSGNTKLLVINGVVTISDNPLNYFSGTVIQLELVINNLQENDEEFIDF